MTEEITKADVSDKEEVKLINYSDFEKLEIVIGKIIKAESIEGADKLLKLTVDLGEENQRTICAGIAEYYQPEEIEGRLAPFIKNLEPRKLKGVESQGMMLMASPDKSEESSIENSRPAFLQPSDKVQPGTKVR